MKSNQGLESNVVSDETGFQNQHKQAPEYGEIDC
jgi:hypothetical protein